jgi:hypothetical protein
MTELLTLTSGLIINIDVVDIIEHRAVVNTKEQVDSKCRCETSLPPPRGPRGREKGMGA